MRICIYGNYYCIFNLRFWLLKLRFSAVIVLCTKTRQVEIRQRIVVQKVSQIINIWLCMCVFQLLEARMKGIYGLLCNCECFTACEHSLNTKSEST
jgi:hypothetical protein